MNRSSSDPLNLMLVTDRRRAGSKLLDIIARVVDAGVDVVQIREKDLNQSELLSLANDIILTVDGRAHILVNSNATVAQELGIGLHLPDLAPPISDRSDAAFGEGVLVGRSIHSAAATVEDRVDYALFGHIFATSSKPDSRPRGLAALAEVVRSSAKPVWAIGGITATNVADIVAQGVQGVAVIGAILDSPDPRRATHELRSAMDRAAIDRRQI